MAAQKPSIPKGTRDFTPDIMVKRNYIFDTIRSVFQLYGFLPIETPAMENLSTLLGKYGDEGDKLLFKVLNSGDFLKKVSPDLKKQIVDGSINLNELTNKISEKGLRYDLTVPFARFVVQNANEISFPFRRYQIQPVWRADRPQKGRYREFYQCDADVVGSDSLLNEIELLQIIDEVFKRLDVNVVVKLNNRKILSGIAEVIGEHENFMAITIAIDKLDKIGIDKVKEEMTTNGVNADAIENITPILSMPSDNIENTISFLKDFLQSSEIGLKGIAEMEYIIGNYNTLDLKAPLEFDITLARGLNYYTGAIIEVKTTDVQIGSISGGGRYDDLTGIFGMKGLSGVGISFGADRIFDVMTQLNNFPESTSATTKVLFINFGEKEALYCIGLVQQLRNAGINTEIYPDAAKMKKQMTYANNRGIEYVALVGENEMNNKEVTIKNMVSGEQETVKVFDLIKFFNK